MASRWYWIFGAAALVAIVVSGSLRADGSSGSFAWFLAAVVLGTIFELGRRSARGKKTGPR